MSVFEYDFSDSSKKNIKPFAQNALRKLRTTRHPDILKFMDAVESESSIFIMTERVRPLFNMLPQYATKKAQETEDWLLWGLHRISVSSRHFCEALVPDYDSNSQVALAFLNDQCFSTHGKISISAIFLLPSGEWKLGGFELFSTPKDEGAVLYVSGCFLEHQYEIHRCCRLWGRYYQAVQPMPLLK